MSIHFLRDFYIILMVISFFSEKGVFFYQNSFENTLLLSAKGQRREAGSQALTSGRREVARQALTSAKAVNLIQFFCVDSFLKGFRNISFINRFSYSF